MALTDEIEQYGRHPALERVAFEVTEDDDVKSIVDELIYTMYKYDAVGMAAPQIGISKRVFVARDIESDSEYDIVAINPKLTFPTPDVKLSNEGCMSLHNMGCIKVPRYAIVDLEAQNIERETYSVKSISGMLAFILQHENDHLDGKLIISGMNREFKRKLKHKKTRNR